MDFQKEYIIGVEEFGKSIIFYKDIGQSPNGSPIYSFRWNPSEATHFDEEQAKKVAQDLHKDKNGKGVMGFISILEISYNWHETFCVHKD